MAEPFTVLNISSEDEAFDWLARALGDGAPPHVLPIVVFRDWPKIEIALPSTPIDGSISPAMMEAFIELQKTIYRAHTFLVADTGDLRALSKAEKESLEFRVRVEKGSSNYEINLNAIFEKLGAEALNKMDSGHIVVTILGLAVIIGGVVAFKAWLNARAQARKQEIEDAGKRSWIELQQASIQQDTERLKILAEAMTRQPMLQEVEASAEEARQEMVKAIGEERGGSFSGITINSEFAGEIVSQKRQQGQEARLAGVYRVARVDTTSPDGFRVTLSDLKSGVEVTAVLLDVLVSEEHRELIKNAEWNKRPVFVEMTARRLRNRVIDAKILNVRESATQDVSAAQMSD
jgi:hypothetical protein